MWPASYLPMSYRRFLLPLLALSALPIALAQKKVDTSHLRFWLERADAIRGPEHYGEDNYFTSWRLGPGGFRGFTANACWNLEGNCTSAVDGASPQDAGAPSDSPRYHKDVISTSGQTIPPWGRCGQWLNSVLSYRGTLYGFVHGENPANGDTGCGHYATHHKTMAQWTSTLGPDAGLSWTNPVEVIDAPLGSPATESGEGDCTAIADNRFVYLFCRRPNDTTSGVARKPLADLADSRVGFIKYNAGWGDQPGLTGIDSPLTGTLAGTWSATIKLGSSASRWKDRRWVMLLNIEDIAFGGLKASVARLSNLKSNAIAFTTLPEPLFLQEPDEATGGYPYETHPTRNLYIYPSVLSPVDGTRNWDSRSGFLLAYTFVPRHNNLNTQRLLAMRTVRVTRASSAQDPQVLVALTTRYDPHYHQRYSSTQPVAIGDPAVDTRTYAPGSFPQIVADPVAWLAQKPASQGQTLIRLVECRSSANPPFPGSGHPDRLITRGACDAGYEEDTIAGYTFPTKPAAGSAVPLYRCRDNGNGTHWVSSSATCEDMGRMEKPLGWGLLK